MDWVTTKVETVEHPGGSQERTVVRTGEVLGDSLFVVAEYPEENCWATFHSPTGLYVFKGSERQSRFFAKRIAEVDTPGWDFGRGTIPLDCSRALRDCRSSASLIG